MLSSGIEEEQREAMNKMRETISMVSDHIAHVSHQMALIISREDVVTLLQAFSVASSKIASAVSL